jgi:hypothetical protein
MHNECFTRVQTDIKASDPNPSQPHLIHKTSSIFQNNNINKRTVTLHVNTVVDKLLQYQSHN